MSTLVCFHAHPDDESIATGGTMMRAVAEGHRVVLVVATRGEHGEVADGFLDEGEQLGLRRVGETFAAARVMGIHRVEFLGYVDSGMMGEDTNDGPYSFWTADIDQAARRLAAILDEEQRDGARVVLTIYDDHGGYGHPDHIQVHRVGSRAAELAGIGEVFEATMNRTQILEHMGQMAEGVAPDAMPDVEPDLGTPEDQITHRIDVSEHVDGKRAAMRAHASQIGDGSFFMAMPEEVFAAAFGAEWFIRHGRPRDGGDLETDLFAPASG